jgi:hypothetical protein
MLCSGDVLGVRKVQPLNHFDAEAGAVREEHRELGHSCLANGVMLADRRAPAQLTA